VAARREQAGSFGPPGGLGARPPDLRTFVEKRTASVAAQLAGKSKGYVPRSTFGPMAGGPMPGGPMPGRRPSEPVNERTIRDLVQAPAEFEVTL
jgi:hypothetical protein